MNQLLTIVPHFPSIRESADGQANYLTQIIPEMAKKVSIQIIALRFGSQTHSERGDGWEVKRIDPPTPLEDVFALYLPAHLEGAVSALHSAALHAAASGTKGRPVWCHGYETGSIVAALVAHGHRVVAVPHYSVGVETLHDLALGDDLIREKAFDSPWATTIGKLTPTSLRPMGVRWASRLGHFGRALPLPTAIQTQFLKLDLERKMVAHASHLVAVGPSFESELNSVYPCTQHRSSHVIAGAPTELPAPQWPWSTEAQRRKFIMVGRPTGQKGWDYAVDALARLEPKQAEEIDLVLIGGLGAGNGPYSAYSDRVARAYNDLQPHRVRNLGTCDHHTVLAHLVAADVLLFPSVFEPLGLVLLEAMAAGCCVLSSNAAGPSDLIQPPWGHVVDFSDPERRSERLHKGLLHFLSMDRSRMRSHGEAAKQAAQEYRWSHCADTHLRALFGPMKQGVH